MAPEGLFYTKTHEWVKIEGETITMGITKHAVDQLQDLVFIDLNPAGEEIDADESFGVIESVKIAADLNTPFAGEITEINEALTDSPESGVAGSFRRGLDDQDQGVGYNRIGQPDGCRGLRRILRE